MKNFKKVFEYLNSIKGCQFIGLRGYESKGTGATTNYVINVGASYENAVKKDIEQLEKLNVATLQKSGFDVETLQIAKDAVLKSLRTPSKNHQKGQLDAYVTIGKGMKLHKTTGDIFIKGFEVSKTVIKEGEYKTVNSSQKTLAKKFIEKSLRRSKYRQFTISNIEMLKGGDNEITLQY